MAMLYPLRAGSENVQEEPRRARDGVSYRAMTASACLSTAPKVAHLARQKSEIFLRLLAAARSRSFLFNDTPSPK